VAVALHFHSQDLLSTLLLVVAAVRLPEQMLQVLPRASVAPRQRSLRVEPAEVQPAEVTLVVAEAEVLERAQMEAWSLPVSLSQVVREPQSTSPALQLATVLAAQVEFKMARQTPTEQQVLQTQEMVEAAQASALEHSEMVVQVDLAL
jgi:hypothetical protein